MMRAVSDGPAGGRLDTNRRPNSDDCPGRHHGAPGPFRLDGSARLLGSDPALLAQLDADESLVLKDGLLMPAQLGRGGAWLRAIRASVIDKRVRICVVAAGPDTVHAVVVPDPLMPAVLVALEHPTLCDEELVGMYAKVHGLTRREAEIVAGLGNGLEPKRIAAARGVAEATVRCHIRSILDKTGAASIRHLQVSIGRIAALTTRYGYPRSTPTRLQPGPWRPTTDA